MIVARSLVCVAVCAVSVEAQQDAVRAERDKALRLAHARLSLFETSDLLEPGADGVVLRALFRTTRRELRLLHEDEAADADVIRQVADILLAGREVSDAAAEIAGETHEPDLLDRLTRGPGFHLQFQYASARIVARQLARIKGIQLRVAEDVPWEHAEMPVDLRGRFPSLERVLEAITESTGLTYGLRDGTIVLVLPDAAPDSHGRILRLAREAVTVLGLLGSRDAELEPLLETLGRHPDRQLAARARAALRVLRGGGPRREDRSVKEARGEAR